MRWSLRIIALVIATGALLAGGSSAALAVESVAPPVDAAAASGYEVTGTPWSAPDRPVKCTRNISTVSCIPVESADTVPSTCYQSVRVGSEETTVCSTAKYNQEELRRAGGELKYEWGCGNPWDVCTTMEGWSESLAASAILTSGTIMSAFQFNTSTLLWSAAVSQWSFWVWAVWIVILAAGIIAISKAAFSGSTADVLSAVVRTGLAFPLTQATLWLMGRVLDSVDKLTIFILSDAPLEKIIGLLFSGGVVNPIGGAIVVVMVGIALMFMLLVLLFRNVALAALIMVGPLAWMLFPMRSIGKEWLVRYFSAFAALLLAGPLMMSLLGMVTTGIASVNSIWDPAVWPFLLALILLCFAPFAVFTLFSFVGGSAVDQAAGSAASRVSGGARNITRAIPRPRAGQSPAGSPSRGGISAGSRGGGSPMPAQSASPKGGAARPAQGRPASATSPTSQPAPAATARPAAGPSTTPPTGRTR